MVLLNKCVLAAALTIFAQLSLAENINAGHHEPQLEDDMHQGEHAFDPKEMESLLESIRKMKAERNTGNDKEGMDNLDFDQLEEWVTNFAKQDKTVRDAASEGFGKFNDHDDRYHSHDNDQDWSDSEEDL